MTRTDEQRAAAERDARASTKGHEVTMRTTKNGVTVKCTCGYEDIAFTTMGAYKRRREHIATHRS